MQQGAHRFRTRRFGTLFLACTVAIASALVVHPVQRAVAAPTTPEIEAKRKEVATAQGTLEDLAADLEMRNEEYQQLNEALAETRQQLDRTRSDLDRARRDLASAEVDLGDRAAQIYRGGGTDIIEVLLGVRDFRDFLTRLDYLRQVARGDASVVASVKDASERVELAESGLEAREAEQVMLRERARAKKAQVTEALGRQQAFIAGLNAEVARLVREERERQARIAAERARLAAARAAQAASKAAASMGRRFEPSTLGGGHPEVVKIALKYLGVPYVWGGSSPGIGFDCSGLTQFVYQEAGISIPRSSRSQFSAGAYIPPDKLDLLRAGDLVFFGYNADPTQVHHVGIYVGDGNFVHAPMTGQDVMVSSLGERIDSRHDYVGACRF